MKKKTLLIVALISLISMNLEAKKSRSTRIKENNDYEELIMPPSDHAHEYGQIDINYSAFSGTLSFLGSSDAIISFEHEPELEVDQMKIEEVKSKFKNRISEMIIFEPGVGCKLDNTGMEIKYHTPVVALVKSKKNKKGKKKNVKHSDFYAYYDLKCNSKIDGTKVKFDFSYFPKLKKLNVSIQSESIKKDLKYEGHIQELELK